MTFESYLAAILASPEDDAPRLAFAKAWAAYDAPLARFVELQVERAQRRRAGDEASPSSEEATLLRNNEARWAHTLAKYTRSWQFDRGFISYVVIDPHLFLEQGAWLMRNAPIHHVGFSNAAEGPFPLDELLASPLLAQLDSIDLPNLELGDSDIAQLAASPHLDRCLVLDLSHNPLTSKAFEALAAGAHTRALLQVHRARGRNDSSPSQQLAETEQQDSWGATQWDFAPLGAAGQALERRFGYLPWLHPGDNACDRFDARWLVSRGALPKRPT
jgi:uncharacterized protein (TIGR02996 family)